MDDIETCKDATKILNFNFEKSENEADWPSGCYVDVTTVYFNYNLIGRLRNSVRHICKAKGKGRIYYLEQCY